MAESRSEQGADAAAGLNMNVESKLDTDRTMFRVDEGRFGVEQDGRWQTVAV